MVNRIIAQAQCWNNAQFIAAHVLLIHKYVDEIQVFDGAYRFMREQGYANRPESTDGTKEIVMNLKLECKLKWFDCDDFWENEIAKKTFMLKFLRKGEWRYWLNDDELPAGNRASAFNRVRHERKALLGLVPMVEPRFTNGTVRMKNLDLKPRFMKWQPGLHFGGKHYELFNGKGVSRYKWPRIILNEMCFLHLKYLRPSRRLKAQLAYEALNL